MPEFFDLSILLLILMGIVVCYLAFGFVRWLAFSLLFHWGGIACLLAGAVVIWIWHTGRRR